MNLLGSLCMCACERGLLSNHDWLVGSVMLAGNWKRNTHTSLHHIRHCGSGASHAGTPASDLWSHTHRRQSDSSLNPDALLLLSSSVFEWMPTVCSMPCLHLVLTSVSGHPFDNVCKKGSKWDPKHFEIHSHQPHSGWSKPLHLKSTKYTSLPTFCFSLWTVWVMWFLSSA